MPYHLPDKYHFKHRFVFFLYNILTKIVKTGESTGVFFYAFNLQNADDLIKLENISKSEILDFLQENGYEAEAYCPIRYLPILAIERQNKRGIGAGKPRD